MNLSGIRTFFRDPAVSKWRKLFVIGAVAYTVLPFDAVPDMIPVLGWLDDLGVLGIAAGMVWRDVKRHTELRASTQDIVDVQPTR